MLAMGEAVALALGAGAQRVEPEVLVVPSQSTVALGDLPPMLDGEQIIAGEQPGPGLPRERGQPANALVTSATFANPVPSHARKCTLADPSKAIDNCAYLQLTDAKLGLLLAFVKEGLPMANLLRQACSGNLALASASYGPVFVVRAGIEPWGLSDHGARSWA
jgi:hypothetical protein